MEIESGPREPGGAAIAALESAWSGPRGGSGAMLRESHTIGSVAQVMGRWLLHED